MENVAAMEAVGGGGVDARVSQSTLGVPAMEEAREVDTCGHVEPADSGKEKCTSTSSTTSTADVVVDVDEQQHYVKYNGKLVHRLLEHGIALQGSVVSEVAQKLPKELQLVGILPTRLINMS